MAKKKNSNNIVFVIIAALVAFYFGLIAKSKQKDLVDYAGQQAVQVATDYVKTQSDVTKDWFKSLGSYWSKVWK